jgi:hypothetical protein
MSTRFGWACVACALLFGAGCGKVEFTTTWTLDAQPAPATDGSMPQTRDGGDEADGGATLDGAARSDAPPQSDARSAAPADAAPPSPDGAMVAQDAPSPSQDAAPDLTPDAGGASGITLAGQAASVRVGSTTAGTPFMDLCPQGQVVIGYQGTQAHSPAMPWLQSVQTRCGTLAIGPGPTYAITTSTGALLPLRGGASGDSWSRMCPSNQVVVGFGGRSSGYVDQLSFHCVSLVITGGPGSYTVSFASITALPPTDSNSGFAFTPIDCPVGQIAAGSNITADNYPRSFGLFCVTPMVSLP